MPLFYKLSPLSLSGHSAGKEQSGKHVFAKPAELGLRGGVLPDIPHKALLHFILSKCLLLFLKSELTATITESASAVST